MSGLARASGLIAALTAASRVLGLVRWLVFAATVGAGVVGSAYGTANSVPNVLYEVAAGGALAAVVVPVVGSAIAADRREDADRVVSALLTWSLVVLVPLALLLWALARPVADALTSDDATAAVAADMLRWFAPQVPLYGVGIVATGALQAHRRFTAAALAPVLSSLVVVAVYLGYGQVKDSTTDPGPAALTLLAAGTTAGVVALSLPLLGPLARAGVRVRPTLRLPAGVGARVWSLTSAGILALVAQQASVLATIRVANAGGGEQAAGALTVYQYGQAVYLLPYAILAVPVATAVFPALAADPDGASPRLAGAARAVVVAGGLGAAALLAAAGPLGRFFAAVDTAGRAAGAVDVAAAMTTLVRALAPGLPGYAAAAVLTRALYVRGRPRTASAWVGLGWLVAAALPLLVLAEPSPVRRLAVVGGASSLGTTLAAVGLVVAVRAAWPRAALAGLPRTAVAAVLAVGAGLAVGALAGPLGDALADAVAGAAPHATTALAAGAVLAGVVQGLLGLAAGTAVVAAVDRATVREGVRALATRGRRPGR